MENEQNKPMQTPALCRGDRQRAGGAGPRRLCADGVPGETGAEEGEPGGL